MGEFFLSRQAINAAAKLFSQIGSFQQSQK